MNQNSPSGRRANSLGVHSIDHFAVEVPDLEAARKFYTLFGLDVRERDDTLELYAVGNPHRWAVLSQGGDAKRLRYLSFGIYPDEADAFAAHLDGCGVTQAERPSRPARASGRAVFFMVSMRLVPLPRAPRFGVGPQPCKKCRGAGRPRPGSRRPRPRRLAPGGGPWR